MNVQQLVTRFHEAFDLCVDCIPSIEGRELTQSEVFTLQRRRDYITEEYKEFMEAPYLDEAMKEACDLVYVILGMFVELGWDFNEAFRRVHASNMSKVDDDGKPMYNEQGKVQKGPNYEPPDLSDLV